MGLFAMVMLYAGLRRGEALALDIDKDVDFENGVIHVRHSLRAEHSSCVIVQPKTKEGIRDVPLFLPLRKALTGKHGNIFTPKDGKKMSMKRRGCGMAQIFELFVIGCAKESCDTSARL